MAAIDDLKAAIAKLGTDYSAELQAINANIAASQAANAGSVSAADAEAIVGQINDLDSKVVAETAALTPAPAPAPAETPAVPGATSNG